MTDSHLEESQEHKLKLLGPDIFPWGGDLPRHVPRSAGTTNLVAGYAGILAGMSRDFGWDILEFCPVGGQKICTKGSELAGSGPIPKNQI